MMHRTRRALLLASAASVGALLLAVPARAQIPVTDAVHATVTTQGWILQYANMVKSLANEARMLANQTTQIAYDVKKYVELVRTADAVIHGNYYALASLVPQLQDLGLVDPWDADAASLQELFTGMQDLAGSVSAIAGEANGLRNQFQFYRPGGYQYSAMSLNGAASQASMALAAANRMMRAAQERARRINGLKGRIGSAADVTDAANAGARVGLETATNTAQSNMLLAAMANQGSQRDVRELQARAAWLASVEQLQADAEAAYANAMRGQVNWQTGTGIRRINYSVPGGDAGDTAEPTMGASGLNASYAVPSGSGDTLGLMQSREWGDAAVQAAASRGITAEALSSFCRIESNCMDVGARAGSTIQGPWQMTAGTSSAAAARAGMSGYDNSNPVQQATAAAEEMRSIGDKLQATGIEPTALNVRAGYQWGAAYAISLNRASPDTPMSSVLSSYSADTLAKNGVTNMTVGQWRASVASKLGASANKSIFPGANA